MENDKVKLKKKEERKILFAFLFIIHSALLRMTLSFIERVILILATPPLRQGGAYNL